MLYAFTKQDMIPSFPLPGNLEIRESDSPELMSGLGQISLIEAVSRFGNENKAFVAYWNDVPAAFGWMAMGKARIGELNHEFILPEWHRYLWNFRTLPDFRGRGIYPHILQHILATEKEHTDCFWIMHAPENNSSQKGILKAGFRFVSMVSVIDANQVIVHSENPGREFKKLIRSCGFINSLKEQATCWNCSSPFVKNRQAECCCEERKVECNHLTVGQSLEVV